MTGKQTTKKEIHDFYASFVKNQPQGISLAALSKAYNENRPENQKSSRAIRLILIKLRDCGSVTIARDGNNNYGALIFTPLKDPPVVEEQTIEIYPTNEDTPQQLTPKQAAFRSFVEELIDRKVDGETYRLETTQWRQAHDGGF